MEISREAGYHLGMEKKKPKRTTVDIADLSETIEDLRKDTAWKALKLAQKVRVLLEEYLSVLEKNPEITSAAARGEECLGESALKCWKKVVKGQKPETADLIKLSGALGCEFEALQSTIEKIQNGKAKSKTRT